MQNQTLQVEVRVVVWRSEDVVACNDFSGLRDLYCRMWMETDSKKKRDTDTHWRCRNGKVGRHIGRFDSTPSDCINDT